MKKKFYQAPEAEYSLLWAQSIICDSLTTDGLEDYDLIDYSWQDEA